MLKYVQPSSIEKDAVYLYAMQNYHARLKHAVSQALALLQDRSERYIWHPWIEEDANWKQAYHPLLCYWIERRVHPALKTRDADQLHREMKTASRFFLIPLLRQKQPLPPFSLLLDDRGDLRFPGHSVFLTFGSQHAGQELLVKVENGFVSLTGPRLCHSFSIDALLGLAPTSSDVVRRQTSIGSTRIEWEPADELVREHLREELTPILRDQSFTEDVIFEPYDNFKSSDIWYYEKVMQVIQTHWPQMHQEITAHIRMINVLNTDKVGGYTLNLFPSAVFLSHRPHDMTWTVENLIHECSHSRMYQLFELDPIFETSNPNRFASPWRQDPRPLEGIFHAVFVFVRIAWWYQLLLQHQVTHDVLERITTVLQQVRTGLDTLKEHAELTSIGEAILEDMEQHYERIRSEVPLVTGGERCESTNSTEPA